MSFPDKKYSNFKKFNDHYLKTIEKASRFNKSSNFKKIISIIEKNYRSKKDKLYVCGNGGSAATANHFACDHQKILFETGRIKPNIISLNSNSSLTTAISNDINYNNIFSEQLKYNSKADDILIVLSCSGNSLNIVNALNFAKKKRIITISFTGFTGGKAKKLSDYNLHVPCDNYGIVEAVHHSFMNIISQYIKHNLYSSNEIKKIIF